MLDIFAKNLKDTDTITKLLTEFLQRSEDDIHMLALFYLLFAL